MFFVFFACSLIHNLVLKVLIRVISFLLSANIGPRSGGGSKKPSFGSGRQTLRFKANGSAKVEDVDDARTLAEEKINELLEGFLGINDSELCKLKIGLISVIKQLKQLN